MKKTEDNSLPGVMVARGELACGYNVVVSSLLIPCPAMAASKTVITYQLPCKIWLNHWMPRNSLKTPPISALCLKRSGTAAVGVPSRKDSQEGDGPVELAKPWRRKRHCRRTLNPHVSWRLRASTSCRYRALAVPSGPWRLLTRLPAYYIRVTKKSRDYIK